MDKKEFTRHEYYRNRELSWLAFNERVLSEARDKTIPLFERLKFLEMVHAGYTKKDIAGMTPEEQIEEITKEVRGLVALQYSTYSRSLLPALKQKGLHVIQEHEALTKEEARYVDRYFRDNVYPVLTPMAVDSSRPFPLIRNKTLNIGALLQKKGEKNAELEFATVQVPSVLPRIVRLPDSEDGIKNVILLEYAAVVPEV